MNDYIPYDRNRDFNTLLGKTLTRVEKVGDDRIEFDADDGCKFIMYHSQDCCETVKVEDIAGDLSDLVGAPILQAEVVENREGYPKPEYPESWTWTFYKLATIKGGVTLRWLGESNGYYSEGVDFAQTRP